MIKILSIGDCIPCEGDFKLHSKFKKAANFVYSDFVISIVDSEIGGGPVNIVVDGFDFLLSEKLLIQDSSILINQEIVQIDRRQIFPSKVILPVVNTEYLTVNVASIVPQIVSSLNDKSFSFLLNPVKEEIHTSDFEKAICKQAIEASQFFANGKMQEGVRLMRGLGSGLTPSGDDFIAGMQAALYCINKISGISNIEEREDIFEWAKSNNHISNTMIYFNSHGFLFSRLKDFVSDFFTFDTEKMKGSLKKMISMGATSGSDIVTGFVFTMLNYKK